ncbi:MAG TPA: hypothetical protein VHU87_14885 [Rhizomicrobium sp.]|jgi:hypothetical protein|nr:hypothetical protein [Rhizomicrobium sp.]
MRKTVLTAMALATLAFAGAAVARNVAQTLSVPDALATPAAHEKLDGSIKFYFGNSAHPAVLTTFDTYSAKANTNHANKDDFVACTWVLLTDLMDFQRHAHDVGANAVINITSSYNSKDVSSDTGIPCHMGYVVASIAIKGDFVKIP